MAKVKRWTVDIYVDEHDDWTYAEARLHTNDKTHITGYGRSQLNPADTNVPEIGDELAAARALNDLGHRLLLVSAMDVQAVNDERVDLFH